MRTRGPRLVLGILALAFGLSGLMLNEWRGGRLQRGMESLRSRVIDADPGSPDLPDGRALRLTGEATAAGVLIDPVLPVRVQALRLDRTVEMYQHKVQEGPLVDRAMRHERVWSEQLMDSGRFANRSPLNPNHMPIRSLRQYASNARLGLLALAPDVLDRLPASRSVAPERPGPVTVAGTAFTRAGDGYRTGDPAGQPAIGDMRIRLSAAPMGRITVIGAVRNGRIVPWVLPDGLEILLADEGDRSTVQLMVSAGREALPGVWQARLGGGAVVLLGFLLVWPRRDAPAPALVTLCGRHPLGGPIVAAVSTVASLVAIGWALFRNPMLWP